MRELPKDYGKTILLSSHILSEIELLADSIGIIHNGVLLEESSYGELKAKKAQYNSVTAESVQKVAHILEDYFKRITGGEEIA